MPSFSVRDATTVLRKLHAMPENDDHKVAIVKVTAKFRLRLYFSHQRGELPSFVRHKWRQQLKLDQDQFAGLIKCTVSGDEALETTRREYGL